MPWWQKVSYDEEVERASGSWMGMEKGGESTRRFLVYGSEANGSWKRASCSRAPQGKRQKGQSGQSGRLGPRASHQAHRVILFTPSARPRLLCPVRLPPILPLLPFSCQCHDPVTIYPLSHNRLSFPFLSPTQPFPYIRIFGM